MSESLYLLTLCLPLGTLLVIFGLKYWSAAQQAKARAAGDEAYRQIAAQILTAQSETAGVLASIDGALSDVRTRLSAVEKILKDVE